jgi:hypothetical protein
MRRRSAVHAAWLCTVATLSAGAWLGAAASAVQTGGAPAGYLQKIRTFHTADEFSRATGGGVAMTRGRGSGLVEAVRDSGVPLPWPQPTVAEAGESADVIWLGSREGAARVTLSARRVEYFAGRRWLPDDHVIGIGRDGAGAWIETPAGFSRIEYRRMTLAEKSRAFVERIQARHVRWGLTADSDLRLPGDLSTNRTTSTDNDGLWTAMYVAAEAFRFAVTRDEDARANASRGMQAIMRLESITGIPGFPARSFIKAGEDVQPKDGEWHDAAETGWRWKGDTSSDEIVGHYFVYPLYHDLVAGDREKPALRAAIERITNHILDNRYQLVDRDGERTRWGWWGPDAIWDDPDETGLRALHMLSHLRVALHLTQQPALRARYRAAYDDLIGTHRYHLLTRNQKIMVPGSINHSDDELAFLSFYPLLRYENDPGLLTVYRQSLERSWRIERPERNPLWNFIYAAGAGATEFDRGESVRTLQEIPMDLVQWTVRNSHRLDVPLDPAPDRHERRQALVVLPYDELPMSKWNGNPYRVDGGNGGRTEDDGAYFLLPYWLGRYHGLID